MCKFADMPPVLGALAGHDMHLAAEKARELVSNATSAEQCGLICRMMEGTSIKGDSAYGAFAYLPPEDCVFH